MPTTTATASVTPGSATASASVTVDGEPRATANATADGNGQGESGTESRSGSWVGTAALGIAAIALLLAAFAFWRADESDGRLSKQVTVNTHDIRVAFNRDQATQNNLGIVGRNITATNDRITRLAGNTATEMVALEGRVNGKIAAANARVATAENRLTDVEKLAKRLEARPSGHLGLAQAEYLLSHGVKGSQLRVFRALAGPNGAGAMRDTVKPELDAELAKAQRASASAAQAQQRLEALQELQRKLNGG